MGGGEAAHGDSRPPRRRVAVRLIAGVATVVGAVTHPGNGDAEAGIGLGIGTALDGVVTASALRKRGEGEGGVAVAEMCQMAVIVLGYWRRSILV